MGVNPSPAGRSSSTSQRRVRTRTKSPRCGVAGIVASPATIDLVWADEEPDEGIYTECLTRTNVASGPIMCTFTPLLGISQVVRRFIIDKSDDRAVVQMTIDDALHYTPEQREQIAASYPEHECAARIKGIPTMGSGAVFPIDLDQCVIDPIDKCSDHWIKVGGIDFGWTHNSASANFGGIATRT